MAQSTSRATKALSDCKNSKEFKAKLKELVGDVSKLILFNDWMLVATYVPHNRAGSIILPDAKADENIYQGVCSLVLSMGPIACHFDGIAQWEGQRPVVGDWVVHSFSEGKRIQINAEGRAAIGVEGRLIRPGMLMGIVSDPDYLY